MVLLNISRLIGKLFFFSKAVLFLSTFNILYEMVRFVHCFDLQVLLPLSFFGVFLNAQFCIWF